MRKLFLRIAVAVCTLTFSLILAGLINRLNVRNTDAPCPTVDSSNTSQTRTDSALTHERDDEYSNDLGVCPYDIERFIDEHPAGNLSPLWKRLKIGPAINGSGEVINCLECKAELFEYDLDNEPGKETIVKISDRLSGSYKYLLFKSCDEDCEGDTEWGDLFIGDIDSPADYLGSQFSVLITDDRPWLIITGEPKSTTPPDERQERLFEIKKGKIIPVLSFPIDGYQSGGDAESWFDRQFDARILACENKAQKRTVTLEFTVTYSGTTLKNSEYTRLALFTKRQKGVFVSNNGPARLQTSSSDITQREINHIYHSGEIDSMTEADFLKYNHSELLNLATRGNAAQRSGSEPI